MELISRGAEAEIYLDKNKIIKKRIQKKYRLKEIDEQLRASRTKREAKILEKMPDEVPHPSLLKAEGTTILMTFIDGKKVRDILEANLSICREIGNKIAVMHNAGIIHGDLTTSNMILHENHVYLIDFGLGFFSHKVEDKAVDLHLLKQALDSRHFKIAEKAFKQILEGYKEESKNYEEIMQRFNKVEMRGRNKARF